MITDTELLIKKYVSGEAKDMDLLIARYLSGEATDKETVDLAEWIVACDENRELFDKHYTYWRENIDAINECDSDVMWESIENDVKSVNAPSPWLRRVLGLLITLAAGCVVTLSAVMINNRLSTTTPDDSFTFASGNSVTTVVLPDGTGATMNRNTVMAYSSSHGGKAHEVTLEGEASFRVAHDDGVCFTVNIEDCRITSQAASFNVSHLPGSDVLTLTPMEGEVCLESHARKVYLEPSQQLSYHFSSAYLSVYLVEQKVISSWKDNLPRYKAIPFADFTAMLETQYGVNIEIMSDALQRSRVNGAFDVSSPVERILDHMQKRLSYQWIHSNDKYVITQ